METLWQDVRYGTRMLAKSPGFTVVAVLTLALGIGVNTAIFSVVKAVLLRSLPYPDPDRLVVLDESEVRTGSMSVAWLNFLDWREQNRSFQDLAAYRQQHFILTGIGEPTLLRVGEVSAPFFPLLGAKPIVGRTFTAAEDKPGASPTAVLSYSFWRSRLGGDQAILGKTLALDAMPYTVVGVLPPDFKYFDRPTDLYLPISLEAGPLNTLKTSFLDRGNHPGLRVLARLRPEASLSSARTDMETIMRRLEQQYPITNSGEQATVLPLYESRFTDIQPALYTLLAAVGLVLLIACANVANLLLARAAARQRELAIRTAIGAGRLRMIRQLLTESVLLSFVGGALGLLVAVWAIGPLVRLAPQNIPRLAETRIDTGVLLFTLGVSVLTGILFGLAPAFQASNLDLNSTLRESGRTGTPGRSHQRLHAGLLVSEVALALVLVVAAGLLIRSLLSAQGVNPGFSPDHILALDVILPAAKYSTSASFFTQAVERIRNLPGVRSASAVFCPPIVGTCWGSVFLIAGRPVPPQAELPQSVFNVVEPGYFRTMQIPLLEGRYFTEADNAKSQPVIIINQSMARRWFSGRSPLGQRIKQGWPESDTPYREIVGVVGDTKQDGLDAEQLTEVFFPIAMNPAPSMTLMVRTASEPMAMAAAVENEIHALDKDQPVSAVQPMTHYMGESLARRKFSTLLLGIFGALALLLASVGIYGVMAYSVAQRTHEMGIRMALGAQRRDVLGLVVGRGLRLVFVGIAIGFAAAWMLTRLLASLLFGVTPRDPVTFVCVVGLLAGVALLACYVPARRATRVDPMVALRYE